MRDKEDKSDPDYGSERLITTGQAASHCQVSLPALRRWIRDGRLKAFQTPGRHARIEVGEFQRFLKEYGMPSYPRSESAARPRVLVVDDDPELLRVFTGILSTHPRLPIVETAADGYDALIKVGIFKPSVLILDIVMPKLDGLEVCRRLRSSPETRGINILAITGRSDMVEGVMAAGADACLTKPFGLDSVNEELERFLGSPERAFSASH
jgi:two-component system response regulator VicR